MDGRGVGVQTRNGPLYRNGGLYLIEGDSLKMGVLEEVYKTKTGGLHAVIEKLTDVTAEKSDPFLIEAKINVWKRTKEYFLNSHLYDLFAVPLLHAMHVVLKIHPHQLVVL